MPKVKTSRAAAKRFKNRYRRVKENEGIQEPYLNKEVY